MYQAFGSFLSDFVRDLNHRSEEGWSLLVEGPRDERAVREIGYRGQLFNLTSIKRRDSDQVNGALGIIILTDLDKEGTLLASKFVKKLNHEGLETSLGERRRLKNASRGVFLHIENLARFAPDVDTGWDAIRQGPPSAASRRYREGLRRFRRV